MEGVIDVYCGSLTSQGVQHRLFSLDDHPSRYQPRPTGLNFGEQTGTGAFPLVTPVPHSLWLASECFRSSFSPPEHNGKRYSTYLLVCTFLVGLLLYYLPAVNSSRGIRHMKTCSYRLKSPGNQGNQSWQVFWKTAVIRLAIPRRDLLLLTPESKMFRFWQINVKPQWSSNCEK